MALPLCTCSHIHTSDSLYSDKSLSLTESTSAVHDSSYYGLSAVHFFPRLDTLLSDCSFIHFGKTRSNAPIGGQVVRWRLEWTLTYHLVPCLLTKSRMPFSSYNTSDVRSRFRVTLIDLNRIDKSMTNAEVTNRAFPLDSMTSTSLPSSVWLLHLRVPPSDVKQESPPLLHWESRTISRHYEGQRTGPRYSFYARCVCVCVLIEKQ